MDTVKNESDGYELLKIQRLIVSLEISEGDRVGLKYKFPVIGEALLLLISST